MYLFMVVLQVCIFSTNDTILAQEDIHLALLSIYFFTAFFCFYILVVQSHDFSTDTLLLLNFSHMTFFLF